MTVAEESGDDHGHHLPAVEDWPRGFGEASWWPFVTAAGGAGIYLAAALFVMSQGENPIVAPIYGAGAFVASVGTFLIGLYGWLYHAFVVSYWERGTDHHSERTLKFAMLLFLGSEVATFGAGFTYYFIIRGGNVWSADLLPHGGVTGWLVWVNTLILIISSVTLHYSHVKLRQDDHRAFTRWLGITLLLGIIFIFGQAYEYYEFIVAEGFTIAEGAYASAFYGLTGLHGLHVSLGAVILGIVYVRAVKGQYSADRHTSVSTASMYWHFVDVVWVFLVAVLYIGATAL